MGRVVSFIHDVSKCNVFCYFFFFFFFFFFLDEAVYTTSTMVDKATVITVEPHLTDITKLHTTTSDFTNDLTEHQETSTDKETSAASFSRLQSTEDITLSHTTSKTSTEELTERNDNPSIGPVSTEMPFVNITTTIPDKTNVAAQLNVTSKPTGDIFPEENLATIAKYNMPFVLFCIVLTCWLHMQLKFI